MPMLFVFVAGGLREMHEVRTFAPCKAFLFDMFAYFSSLENYFGFRTTIACARLSDSIVGTLSPPQRLPLGIPIKISIIEKIESAWGTMGRASKINRQVCRQMARVSRE